MSYKKLLKQLPTDLTDIIVDYHNDISSMISQKRHKRKFNKLHKQLHKRWDCYKVYNRKRTSNYGMNYDTYMGMIRHHIIPFEDNHPPSQYNIHTSPQHRGLIIDNDYVLIFNLYKPQFYKKKRKDILIKSRKSHNY